MRTRIVSLSLHYDPDGYEQIRWPLHGPARICLWTVFFLAELLSR